MNKIDRIKYLEYVLNLGETYSNGERLCFHCPKWLDENGQLAKYINDKWTCNDCDEIFKISSGKCPCFVMPIENVRQIAEDYISSK